MSKTLNWFPGHMKKGLEEIQNKLDLFDIMLQVVDSRCPWSSRNEILEDMTLQHHKKIIYIATKNDLADQKITKQWEKKFTEKGLKIYFVDLKKQKVLKVIKSEIDGFIKQKMDKGSRKGLVRATVRLMIAGVPNVGKSTLINQMAGRKSANVGNMPGVTKSQQIIKIDNNIELLDTPGILLPKLEPIERGYALVYANIIKLEILNIEDIASNLMKFVLTHYLHLINEKYQIKADIENIHHTYEILAQRLNYVLTGNDLDLYRTYKFFIQEVQKGRLGKISFETP